MKSHCSLYYQRSAAHWTGFGFVIKRIDRSKRPAHLYPDNLGWFEDDGIQSPGLTCHDQCRSRVTSHHPLSPTITTPYKTHSVPLCMRDSNRLRKHAVLRGRRLVGGERAAPMRLPLVAGGEGGGGKGWQVVVGKL